MSSHHIVRDEQEPALLIWESGQADFEQVAQLLEWSPRVVVHQQALAETLNWNIKLDAVWASPDMREPIAAAVAHQQPLTLLALPEKERLAAALTWLASLKQKSTNLLANAAAEKYLLLQQLAGLQKVMQVQVISAGWRYSFFGQGMAKKWLPAHTLLRLVSFKALPDIRGVMLLPETEAAPARLLQTTEAGMLELSAAEGFWLGEKL